MRRRPGRFETPYRCSRCGYIPILCECPPHIQED